MGGPWLTWALLVVGVGGWVAAQILYPLHMDNIPAHLAITGIAAIVGGVGLSRTRLGREQSRP